MLSEQLGRIVYRLEHRVRLPSTLMTTVVASLGGGSDDSFLQDSQEVASCFLQLYLPEESDMLTSRSPAQNMVAKGELEVSSSAVGVVADGSQDQLAVQVAERLRRIGDEINARVGKELHEATADLLRQQSVFQIGLKQFRGMCRRVLVNCSGRLQNGWEQMAVIYITMGELVRELRRQGPQDQSSHHRELQFQQFAGQVMQEVGLQRWVIAQGGIRMMPVRVSEPLRDSSQPLAHISEVD